MLRFVIALTLALPFTACLPGGDDGIDGDLVAEANIGIRPTGVSSIPPAPPGFSTGAIEQFRVINEKDRLIIEGPILSMGATRISVKVGNAVPADPFTGKVPPEPVAKKFVVLVLEGDKWTALRPITELSTWDTPADGRTYGLMPVYDQVGAYYGVLSVRPIR